MKAYQINSNFHFGKHINKSLLEVCKSDGTYISWCMINLEHFFISDEDLAEIFEAIPNFRLSFEASQRQQEKQQSWDSYYSEPEDHYDFNDPYEDYGSSGKVFGWYNGWSDDAIYDAFEGDPEATWNVD